MTLSKIEMLLFWMKVITQPTKEANVKIIFAYTVCHVHVQKPHIPICDSIT